MFPHTARPAVSRGWGGGVIESDGAGSRSSCDGAGSRSSHSKGYRGPSSLDIRAGFEPFPVQPEEKDPIPVPCGLSSGEESGGCMDVLGLWGRTCPSFGMSARAFFKNSPRWSLPNVSMVTFSTLGSTPARMLSHSSFPSIRTFLTLLRISRGHTKREDTLERPTQSHISPSIQRKRR